MSSNLLQPDTAPLLIAQLNKGDPNVHAVGLGFKVTNYRNTGQLAVRFSTTRKGIPETRSMAIDEKVRIFDSETGREMELPTDVIESARPKPSILLEEAGLRPTVANFPPQRTNPSKPYAWGVGSRNMNVRGMGTYGNYSIRPDGIVEMASDWHVWKQGNGTKGDPIVIPVTYGADSIVAVLDRWYDLVFNSGAPWSVDQVNSIDYAGAVPMRPGDLSPLGDPPTPDEIQAGISYTPTFPADYRDPTPEEIGNLVCHSLGGFRFAWDWLLSEVAITQLVDYAEVGEGPALLGPLASWLPTPFDPSVMDDSGNSGTILQRNNHPDDPLCGRLFAGDPTTGRMESYYLSKELAWTGNTIANPEWSAPPPPQEEATIYRAFEQISAVDVEGDSIIDVNPNLRVSAVGDMIVASVTLLDRDGAPIPFANEPVTFEVLELSRPAQVAHTDGLGVASTQFLSVPRGSYRVKVSGPSFRRTAMRSSFSEHVAAAVPVAPAAPEVVPASKSNEEERGRLARRG